jgi:hypothetical protein
MRESSNSVLLSGEEIDDSFVVYYSNQIYNSRYEAYHARDLTDTFTDQTRLGWVIMRGDCVDLKNKETATIISTDRFGIQAYSPPYITDKERIRDLHVENYIFDNSILLDNDNNILTT